MDALKIILTSLSSAVALFVVAKLLGHKQLAQLDFFDYVTGITIGSVAAELATELEEPYKPFIALVVYCLISLALSFITHKFPRARKYINGTPTIVMSDGRLYRKNLKKAKLDLSELSVLFREAGYFDLADVHTAVFEPNGKLTVLPRAASRPLTPEDMSIKPKPAHICTELIMDGRVLEGNLKRMGLDSKWLDARLHEAGYDSPRKIFYAVCDEKRKITFYKGE